MALSFLANVAKVFSLDSARKGHGNDRLSCPNVRTVYERFGLAKSERCNLQSYRVSAELHDIEPVGGPLCSYLIVTDQWSLLQDVLHPIVRKLSMSWS
jgi:hypothetical protein